MVGLWKIPDVVASFDLEKRVNPIHIRLRYHCHYSPIGARAASKNRPRDWDSRTTPTGEHENRNK